MGSQIPGFATKELQLARLIQKQIQLEEIASILNLLKCLRVIQAVTFSSKFSSGESSEPSTKLTHLRGWEPLS